MPRLPRFALCLVVLLLGLAPRALAARQPNIVLIFADDLGYRDVAFQSDGFIETPHLDRLRSEGMVFTSAYAGAGNCAPSRACLLSGKYTPRHGVYAVNDTARGPKDRFRLVPIPNSKQLRSDFVTMAEALKAQGYATGHFGKWHLGGAATATGPRDQGFDVSARKLGAAVGEAGEDGNQDPKLAFSIARAAGEFMEQNKERPFFAFVAHHGIHTPLEARPETLRKFRAKAAGAKVPHVKAKYAACIHDLDAAVGEMLAKIDSLGLANDTLVVFTSDNGATPDSINEPLRGAKGGYYEGGIREPFLVRWPGVVKAGGTSDVPTINLDLYPTFVAAAGGTPAGDLDGESLLPILRGEAETLKRTGIFWHFPGYLDTPVPRGRDPVFRTRPVSVLRKGDWKLHLYHEEWQLEGGRESLSSNRAVELYNLAKDIGEREDLAQAEPAKRDELLADLLAWIEKTQAPFAKVPAKSEAGDR